MINIKDLKLVPYREAWEIQKNLQSNLLTGSGDEYLLLVEHPPVFTLGFHGHSENMLLSEKDLETKGIEFVRIERGGDVTFHGPGQLVVYPIINLKLHKLGVKDYIHLLEEAIILTIKHFGIIGERVDGATGVWIEKGTPSERKICAIGVKCRRFTTMHGLALNVNTDLSYFNMINPCGFVDKGVTSIEKEIGSTVEMSEVKKIFTETFLHLLYPESNK